MVAARRRTNIAKFRAQVSALISPHLNLMHLGFGPLLRPWQRHFPFAFGRSILSSRNSDGPLMSRRRRWARSSGGAAAATPVLSGLHHRYARIALSERTRMAGFPLDAG